LISFILRIWTWLIFQIGYPSHQFMEYLVSIFTDNASLFPSELRLLHISAKSMSDRVNVKGTIQLIEKLSPLIGELHCNLNSCSLSLLENYSKELWNAIGTCANLRKLTLLSMENCDQFCEVEMISNLNRLPLTKLRYVYLSTCVFCCGTTQAWASLWEHLLLGEVIWYQEFFAWPYRPKLHSILLYFFCFIFQDFFLMQWARRKRFFPILRLLASLGINCRRG
jgi:hypothetical protein